MIYNKEGHHLSYDIRQSYKPAKVHAVVSENKPKDTPRLKSKVWFTLLDLYPQTVPLINQPCSSCPLLSSPLHRWDTDCASLTAATSCQKLLPLLSNTELGQG